MWKSLLQTAVVLTVGVLLSIVGGTELDELIQPKDFVAELHKAQTVPARSPESREIMLKLRHAGDITIYVSDPLAGLIVGVFVGLVQRRRPTIMALSCMTPNFLLSLFSDNVKDWARSPSGVVDYMAGSSLPFIAAVAGAGFAHWLILRGSRPRKAIEA